MKTTSTKRRPDAAVFLRTKAEAREFMHFCELQAVRTYRDRDRDMRHRRIEGVCVASRVEQTALDDLYQRWERATAALLLASPPETAAGGER